MKELMHPIHHNIIHESNKDILTTCECCGRQYYATPLYELYGVCSVECFAVIYYTTFEDSKMYQELLKNKLYMANLNFNALRSD
jgi:hypothetical protein